MILEARATSKGHPLWQEILAFVLVFLVAGLTIEGTLQTIILIPGMIGSTVLQDFILQSLQTGSALSYDNIMVVVSDIIGNPWVMQGMLFSTVGLSAGVLIYCRAIERRSFASMGIRRSQAVREYLIGAAVGLILLAAAAALCLATGALHVERIASVSAGFLAFLLVFLIGFILQGFSEELLCRGYFMVSLARRQSLFVAVIVSSVAFSFLHLMNPGVFEQPLAIMNIVLFGVFVAIYVLKRGDIWGAAAAHSLWNFAQGNLFGIAVSGTANLPSLVYLRAPDATEAPWASWINGGVFGLEGGLAVTVVLAAATAIILFLPDKRETLLACVGQAAPAAHAGQAAPAAHTEGNRNNTNMTTTSNLQDSVQESK
jgi:membrane protease YdiL (CAAX protease family)